MRACLLSLLLLTSTAMAGPRIPVELRVKSYASHCLWCSLLTVAQHQGVDTLYSILKEIDKDPKRREDGGAHFEEVHDILLKRKIAHYYRRRGDKSLRELVEAVSKKDIGVVVSLDNDPGTGYNHAVVLVGLWADCADYIDPDNHTRITTITRTEFDKRWNGQALYLDYLPMLRPLFPSEIKRVLVAELKKR